MSGTNGVADKDKFPGPSIIVRFYYHIATHNGRVLIRLVAQSRAYETCLQANAWCSVVLPPPVVWGSTAPHPPLRTKAMETGPRPSLIAPLIALTAQLDGLCTDQTPEELCTALKIAFEKRDLYKLYVSFLAQDEKRARALLEVFDKV